LDTPTPKFVMQGQDPQLKIETWEDHSDNLLHQDKEELVIPHLENRTKKENHINQVHHTNQDNLSNNLSNNSQDNNLHQGNHSDQEQVILH